MRCCSIAYVQMRQRGRQPVDEHQLVPGSGTDVAPSRTVGERGQVPGLPQRSDLGHQFRDHLNRQARDPPVLQDDRPSECSHHA
jgi:hypothetical protein